MRKIFDGVKNFGQWVTILILVCVTAWVILYLLSGFSKVPDVLHNSLVIIKVQLNEDESAGGQCTYFFAQKEEKGFRTKFTATSVCGLYQVNDKILLTKGK